MVRWRAKAGAIMRRAVFFGWDGVINRPAVCGEKPYPPGSLDDFELLPGVADAIRAMKDGGYLVVVATNRPDIATGKPASRQAG